jgi:hypothetical protein
VQKVFQKLTTWIGNTHCFLIHLNDLNFFINIKNTQIHGLTLRGQSSFFSKTTSKLPFLAQEAQTIFILFEGIFNCKILYLTTRRTCAKSFSKVDYMDWKREDFFPCAWQRKKLPILRKKTSFLS